MQDIIQYLNNNEEVLIKVKEERASLLGVSKMELQAILEVFFDNEDPSPTKLWK